MLLMKVYPFKWYFWFFGQVVTSNLIGERKKCSVLARKEEALQCGGRMCNHSVSLTHAES